MHAGKGRWRLGKQGGSIKAAKALQHPHTQSQGALEASDSLVQIPSQSSPPKWRGEIDVMDSVLSLEGSPAATREWGRQVEGKHPSSRPQNKW